jgi:ribosomal protein S18 acetylase RimI-like enzyme
VPAGLADLIAAYHLATEAEKGAPVAGVADLPDRYSAEVVDPRTAFAGDVVLVARHAGAAAGCVVVTTPAAGRTELKRLWVDPAARGRGIAATLVRAALAEATGTLRLSVWRWRHDAIALYERLGFTTVPSWDDRPDLVCMAYTG